MSAEELSVTLSVLVDFRRNELLVYGETTSPDIVKAWLESEVTE